MSDTRKPNQYASPPCFLHELDATNTDPPARSSEANEDVARWRKAERECLIASRLAMDPQARLDHSNAIARHLDEWVGDTSQKIVSAYWPFRGEPNLHSWLEGVRKAGGRTALPVVVKKGAPLVFRLWAEGGRLERGVWNIPIPADGEEVIPDVVIAPLVGFDRAGYRLGYGGGFFDRTLAAFPAKPKVVGVGYEITGVETIYPQWHDIPMDAIVTEAGLKTFNMQAEEGKNPDAACAGVSF